MLAVAFGLLFRLPNLFDTILESIADIRLAAATNTILVRRARLCYATRVFGA